MDLSYTVEEEAFRQELVDWLQKNLPDGWLSGKRVIPKDRKEREIFLRNWQRKLYEGGWAGISWPKEYGGRGASLIEQVIFEEEMARFQAPPVINRIGIGMVGPTLIVLGTEYQKSKYIPKILNGEEIWCQGYSEPNAGSDLAAIQTQAVRDGDHFVINGKKIWTSYATMSQRCFLLARTSKHEKKHKGITAFIVDMNNPGITINPIKQMNGDSEFNEVVFTDVRVPQEDVVGEVDDGWKVALTLLGFERVFIASMAFNLINVLSKLISTAKSNIGNFSLENRAIVKDKIASLYVKVQGAKYTLYRTMTEQLKTGKAGPEGSIVKLICSELNKELHNMAMDLLGMKGHAWLRDEFGDDVNDWIYGYLTSFHLTIAGGTSEIQKNIVAERLLGLPKDIKF